MRAVKETALRERNRAGCCVATLRVRGIGNFAPRRIARAALRQRNVLRWQSVRGNGVIGFTLLFSKSRTAARANRPPLTNGDRRWRCGPVHSWSSRLAARTRARARSSSLSAVVFSCPFVLFCVCPASYLLRAGAIAAADAAKLSHHREMRHNIRSGDHQWRTTVVASITHLVNCSAYARRTCILQ